MQRTHAEEPSDSAGARPSASATMPARRLRPSPRTHGQLRPRSAARSTGCPGDAGEVVVFRRSVPASSARRLNSDPAGQSCLRHSLEVKLLCESWSLYHSVRVRTFITLSRLLEFSSICNVGAGPPPIYCRWNLRSYLPRLFRFFWCFQKLWGNGISHHDEPSSLSWFLWKPSESFTGIFLQGHRHITLSLRQLFL